MNSCFIISDSFLSWFSHCSWKRIISINNTQHVHPSSYFLVNHLAPYFITETEVMGELSHFPTMKSTYLHLNSSFSKSNLLLSSLVLAFLHLLPSCYPPYSCCSLHTWRIILLAFPQTHKAHSSFKPLYLGLSQLETFFPEIFLVTIPPLSSHSIPYSSVILSERLPHCLNNCLHPYWRHILKWPGDKVLNFGWFLQNAYARNLEKAMAPHSSVLAWRIPGWGSLVGCRLWGRTGSDMTEAT